MIEEYLSNYKLILHVSLIGILIVSSSVLTHLYVSSIYREELERNFTPTTLPVQNEEEIEQDKVPVGILRLDYGMSGPDDLLNEYIVSEIEKNGAVLVLKEVGYETEYVFESKEGEVILAYFYAHGIPCPETEPCGNPSFTITYPKGLYLQINPSFSTYKLESVAHSF